MAVRVPSSCGLVANTSSQSTKDSSTFCMRTNARAFKPCGACEGKVLYMYEQRRTFTRGVFGAFFRNLLHASNADLLDPASSASGWGEARGKQGDVKEPDEDNAHRRWV